MKSCAVIIVAAGKGIRFGSGLRKQYQELAGRPILQHTLTTFCTHPLIEPIVVVVPRGEQNAAADLIETWNLPKPAQVVEGGEERHESVWNGLRALPENCEWVAVHDGVRPLITHAVIDRVLAAAEKYDSAIAAIQPADTIKTRSGDFVERTLERPRLLAVQTPQAFRRSILQRAYETAGNLNRFATDDAALVEQLGLPVAVVEGDPRNIKITTPVDLLIARALLEENYL